MDYKDVEDKPISMSVARGRGPESKAEITDAVSRKIIDEANLEMQQKTERLRSLRLAREAKEAATAG